MSHIFLTGPKQVGKSTLIGKYLAQYPGRVGGFRTRRTHAWLGDRWSVHLLSGDGSGTAGAENLLFICGCPSPDTPRRFDALGCTALEEPCDLILMDEVGPNEAQALEFQKAVFRALDGKTPILGVLQMAQSDFLSAIAAHPKVTVISITEENRDSPELLDRIEKQLWE